MQEQSVPAAELKYGDVLVFSADRRWRVVGTSYCVDSTFHGLRLKLWGPEGQFVYDEYKLDELVRVIRG